MERMRYIRVPKDIKTMEDYEYGVQKVEQMEEFYQRVNIVYFIV